jgi:hypothetical protein
MPFLFTEKAMLRNVVSTVLLILAICLLAGPAAAQVKEMPAGLWQITNKMDMPGMPPEMAAKMAGGMTVTHCVKAGERKWNDQRAPMERGERKCEPVESKVAGNKVSWKLKCADGTTGEGTMTHNGKDAYSMNMTMNSPRGSMSMKSEGKKIADTCEKAKP